MNTGEIIKALSIITDPELGVSIIDLGLIYSVTVQDESVDILMTFTTPACPFASSIIHQIEEIVESTYNLNANVTITFDPPWSLEKVSEAAKLEMGLL